MSFSASRYFHSPDERSSLARALPGLERLAQVSQDASLPESVQLHGRLLQAALRDFARAIAEEVLREPGLSFQEVLDGYLRYHRRAPGH